VFLAAFHADAASTKQCKIISFFFNHFLNSIVRAAITLQAKEQQQRRKTTTKTQ
jgi:hypothetical protein